MTILVFISDSNCDLLVNLAGQILGLAVKYWKKYPHTVPNDRSSIFAISRQAFNSHCPDSSAAALTAVLCISLRCIGEVQVPEINCDAFDHEYCFSRKTFNRRDFVRFLSLILGESDFLALICKKKRSYYIGMTFPNVNVVLPNLSIVSVGADALELRVDLLKDQDQNDDNEWSLPPIDYVASQLMALRSCTELPVIFTIRFERSGGRWPISASQIAIQYLRKAIQWGVEFLDVENVIGDQFFAELAALKGHTKVIASYHGLNGALDWGSKATRSIYEKCCQIGDIVQMIGYASKLTDNYELEKFKRWSSTNSANPVPLIAFNSGAEGKLSRILNDFLQPTTHHLLPVSSAPHQLTLLEANSVLKVVGQIKPVTVCLIDNHSSSALLVEKCFNELGLPHKCVQFASHHSQSIESMISVSSFGGALLLPHTHKTLPILESYAPESSSTGIVDTIVVRQGRLVGHNCVALGVISSLLRYNLASAYVNQSSLVVASSYIEAASVMYALMTLQCKVIYILGFKLPANTPQSIKCITEQFHTIAFNKGTSPPIGVFSALPTSKANLLPPLIRMVEQIVDCADRPKIFLDLANGSSRSTATATARAAGWRTIAGTDITASTTVERMRILVDQSVPYDFLKMVQKRGLY